MDAKNRESLVEFRRAGRIDVGTVRTSSVLSAINVAEFGQEVINHIGKRKRVHLLLSLEHVDYLSSAVLTELLRIHKAIEERKGSMRICAVSHTIREIFEITNLDKLFVLSDEDAAANIRKFERALEIAAEDEAWQEPTAEA